MSRWAAQRPHAVQGKSSGESSGGEKQVQTAGSNQRTSARRGHVKQVGGIGMLLHHSEDFNLTPQQEEKLLSKQLEFEIEKINLEAAVKIAKVRWRAAARDVNTTEKTAYAVIDDLTKAEANLRKMRFQHLKEGRTILNASQRGHLQKFHLLQSRQKAKAQGGGSQDDES